MSTPKRATIYFDPDIHRTLRLRAATSDRSISDMVNDAVKLTLAEDAEDLAAFDERKREPNLDFEQFVRALKRRGKIQGSDQVRQRPRRSRPLIRKRTGSASWQGFTRWPTILGRLVARSLPERRIDIVCGLADIESSTQSETRSCSLSSSVSLTARTSTASPS